MSREESIVRFQELIGRLQQENGLTIREIELLFEKAVLTHLLNQSKGNISRAARLCEKHRNGLAREMKKFGLSIKQWNRQGSRGPRKRAVYEAVLARLEMRSSI
jgi:transcriptional regulator of acetoin/glycerol metabolism